MKKNMGIADRVIRILIAVAVTILYFSGIISGTLGIVLLVLSGVFLLTGIVALCPLYLPFGIKTFKSK